MLFGSSLSGCVLQLIRQQQKVNARGDLSPGSRDPTSDTEPGQVQSGQGDQHREEASPTAPPHGAVVPGTHHEGAAGPTATPTSSSGQNAGNVDNTSGSLPPAQPKLEPGTEPPSMQGMGGHGVSQHLVQAQQHQQQQQQQQHQQHQQHQQQLSQDLMHQALGRSPHMGHTPMGHDGSPHPAVAAAGMHPNPAMNPHFNHPFSITNLMGPPDTKMDLKMYETMAQGGYSAYGQISPVTSHHMGAGVKDNQQPPSMVPADGYYKTYTPHSTAAL